MLATDSVSSQGESWLMLRESLSIWLARERSGEALGAVEPWRMII